MATKKKSNKIFIYLGVIVGGLILFFIVGKSAGWIGQAEKTFVEIATVKPSSITEKVTASGKVQPEVEVKISPDVSGEITELYVAEGDSVVKGQLLLRIRPDNYQTAVSRTNSSLNNVRAGLAQSQERAMQAAAQFVRVQASFKRNTELHTQKVISDAEFDQFTSEYKVAEAEVNAARQNINAAQYNVQSATAVVNEASDNLSRTAIYAPMSGIISKLVIEKGERVVGTAQMSGTELLRIANLNEMEVRVDVNETDIVRIALGDTAIVEVDSYRDRQFKGIVSSISNTAKATLTADAVTEFEVKVRILGSSYADLKKTTGKLSPFRPGMTASVDIVTERKNNIISVPNGAIVAKSLDEVKKREEGEKDFKKMDDKAAKNATDEKNKKKSSDKKDDLLVFVYDEKTKKVEARKVEIGISDFDNMEITKGIKEGEKVVSAPSDAISKKLRTGDEVTTEKKGKK